jgi:hypothetical protein
VISLCAPTRLPGRRAADYSLWQIRLFFAYTRPMKVVENERRPDWPKLGPSIIIATALIVAIRTAKWVAKSSADAQFSDVDVELDKEVIFAARISIRVMHELLRRHESLFPQRVVPIYEGGSEEDSPP